MIPLSVSLISPFPSMVEAVSSFFRRRNRSYYPSSPCPVKFTKSELLSPRFLVSLTFLVIPPTLHSFAVKKPPSA